MENLIFTLAALVIVALILWVILLQKRSKSQDVEIARLKADLSVEAQMRASEAKMHQEAVERLRDDHEKTLKTIREDHEKSVTTQLEGVKAALAAENAKLQKQNEESLKKEASESFKNITGTLNEDIRKMKESFDAQKQEHMKATAEIKTQFQTTADNLIKQTNEVSKGAENLAAALRGGNKMQGCMGETILENIFQQEGMCPGRDFDREYTIRDSMGNVVVNEDLGSRMRPDFVLHFPDNTDVIVDSKVSLSALSDYYAAQTEAERDAAEKRNYDSVVSHIKELTSKEYEKYLSRSGRKTMGYVMMFIPNYGAYQLAKHQNPNLFAEAFAKNVLITTEETIMPFLRIIRSAWVNQEQIQNQQKIIDGAQRMVERVAAFCEDNEKIGKKLREAIDTYDNGKKKLEEGGKSIVHAAREVIKLGVPKPKKPLPEPLGIVDTEDSPALVEENPALPEENSSLPNA